MKSHSCTGANRGKKITKHVNKELRRSACHTNGRSQVCWVTKLPHNTFSNVQILTQMMAASSAIVWHWIPVSKSPNVSNIHAVQFNLQLAEVIS